MSERENGREVEVRKILYLQLGKHVKVECCVGNVVWCVESPMGELTAETFSEITCFSGMYLRKVTILIKDKNKPTSFIYFTAHNNA